MSYPCGCGQAFPTYSPFTAGSCNAGITSDLYTTLTSVNGVKLLGVAPGTTSQVYLTGTNGPSFLMWDTASNSFKTNTTPALSLPVVNPAVSGNFPATGNWASILIASGSAPQQWQFATAPTSGSYLLGTTNGTFGWLNAGTVPGINQVAQSGAVWAKADVLSVNLVNGAADTRKLMVVNKRVLVGDTTGGIPGYQPLADSVPLEHPLLAVTDTARFYKAQALDVNGAAVSTGFPIAVATGGDPTTDFDFLGYSLLKKQIMRQPVHTVFQRAVNLDGSWTPTGSYGALPGTHGTGGSENYNYKTVLISFSATLRVTGDTQYLQFAVFRDGQMVVGSEKDNDNARVVVLDFVDTNVPPGAHTYDVRGKRSSGSGAFTVANSQFIVRTIG